MYIEQFNPTEEISLPKSYTVQQVQNKNSIYAKTKLQCKFSKHKALQHHIFIGNYLSTHYKSGWIQMKLFLHSFYEAKPTSLDEVNFWISLQ